MGKEDYYSPKMEEEDKTIRQITENGTKIEERSLTKMTFLNFPYSIESGTFTYMEGINAPYWGE